MLKQARREFEQMKARPMSLCARKKTNWGKYLNPPCSRLLVIGMIIISILVTTPLTTIASDLDDFEEAATGSHGENSSKKKDAEKQADEREEDEDDDIVWNLFEITLHLVAAMAEVSEARLGNSTKYPPGGIELRRNGEPTLPFFQIEENFIRINSDITALDTNLELGSGALGFRYRHSTYKEKYPSDELICSQWHCLLRISASSAWELGAGIGSLQIRGNERNSGFSLTTPVKVYPTPYLGIRIKPSFNWINGNYIGDYDFSLAFAQRYWSAVLGYRFLKANDVDLNGAYTGLTFYY